MKSLFSSLFALLYSGILSAAAAPGSINEADLLFKKELYDDALHKYEAVIASSSGEIKLKAVYRAAECQALLFKYADAVTRLHDFTMPEDPVWKGRFLLLKAALGNQYLRTYANSMPSDEQQGTKDLTKRTAAQWKKEISASYSALWPLRAKLAEVPIAGDDYFLKTKVLNPSIPTLWDFAVMSWTGYLLEQEETTKVNPIPFAVYNYAGQYKDSVNVQQTVAALYEEAFRMGGRGREQSSEEWKLKRVLLPINNQNLFLMPGDNKLLKETVLAALADCMSSFKVPESKAGAGSAISGIYVNDKNPVKAVEACENVISKWHGTKAASLCAATISGIKAQSLEITGYSTPDGRDAVSCYSKNIPVIYYRLYKTSLEALMKENRNQSYKSFSPLRYPDSKFVETLMAQKKIPLPGSKPAISGEIHVQYDKQYEQASSTVSLKNLDKGLYVAVLSSDPLFIKDKAIMRATIVNVSDVFLIARSGLEGEESKFLSRPGTGTGNIFHFYAVNALTGRPVQDGKISAYVNPYNLEYPLYTDKDGRAEIAQNIDLNYPSSTYFGMDAILTSGKGLSILNSPLSFHFSPNAPFEIYVETDRPIYRPGQTVSFKATALKRVSGGLTVAGEQKELAISARDANYQEIYTASLKLNDMGSAAGTFTLPDKGLLGTFTITATLREGQGYTGQERFEVEEYKRPEFEVSIKDAAGPWKYGDKSRVEGTAKYYFGGPVSGAKIKYRVFREAFIPWFLRIFFWFYIPEQKKEIASGELVAGKDGRFSFEFTPEPGAVKYRDIPSTFSVEVDALDAGGRVISAAKTFRAGSKAFMLMLKPEQGFVRAGKESSFSAALVNLNETRVSAAGEYALYKLSAAADSNTAPVDAARLNRTAGKTAASAMEPQDPSNLNQVFAKVPDGEKVTAGQVQFLSDKDASVRLPALAEGIYRIKFRAKDAWGGDTEQSSVIICAGDKPSLPLESVTLAQQTSVKKGQSAVILLGSSKVTGYEYVEIWGGNFLLDRAMFPSGGLHLLTIPVSDKHDGGITVKWFGAADYKIYTGSADISVPRPEKVLSLELKHPETVKPGEKVRWDITAKDSSGKPVSGEVSIRMFDRSLEYYQAERSLWAANLYPPRVSRTQGSFPINYFYWTGISEDMRRLLKQVSTVNAVSVPEFIFSGRGFAMLAGANFVSDAMYEGDVMDKSARFSKSEAAPAPMGKAKGAAEPVALEQKETAAAPAARKDFSETAYYNPQLKLENGRGATEISMPERLTSWKISAYAITKDVNTGTLSSSVITRKDLMLRLELPRFLREKDSGSVKAMINNETGTALTAKVTLSLKDGQGNDAAAKYAVTDTARTVAIPAHSQENVSWTLKVPSGLDTVSFTAAAEAGTLTDAEEKTIPVLTSRQRLSATDFKALDGDSSVRLELKELQAKDDTREMESVHLQLDPQLALSILASIPYLYEYPHECTEQLLNRYVPLAVMNAVYAKYPAIAAATAKIPARTSLTPAWERDNPVRMMQLMETPWLALASGERKPPFPALNMLDPKKVKETGDKVIDKLKTYQLDNGGFPWMPGGEANLYMTLYALGSFAEAAQYGVAVPKDMIKKAVTYAIGEIDRIEKKDENSVCSYLYAAYVMTSFPKDWNSAAYGKAAKWLARLENKDIVLNRMGKTLAAHVHFRLGHNDKALFYLDQAMAGATEDPISGLSWTPEKNAWHWYNDNIETHAFILRTLLAIKPQDKRIPGMVRWLVFNRKGTAWKSTKSSAAAVFSLLDVMQKRGALDKDETYSVGWDGDTKSLVISPTEWLDKPVRWSKYGQDIVQGDTSATVEKKGPGIGFASLSAIYTTDKLPAASDGGMLNVRRTYFLRKKEGDGYVLKPLASGDTVTVGDQLEIHLEITARAQFEYVWAGDPRGAGFEADTLNSGWKWDGIGRYEEPRDSLSNFFFSWLPQGEYVLKYRIKPTTPGSYRIGAAMLQSMYSPEFSAHSDGIILNVK